MSKPKVHLTKRRNPSGKLCYTVRWFDFAAGKYRSKACGPDREHALEVKMQKRKAIWEGIDDEIMRVDWNSFVTEHIENLGGAAPYRKLVKNTLRQFGDVCKPQGPHLITFSMVERFVQYLRSEFSPATVNRKMRELRQSLDMAVKRSYARRNPATDIKRDREDDPIPVVLTDAEKQAILDACLNTLWRCFLYVLATTGCRRGEILNLTWDRVNFDDGYIRLTKTKSKRDRLQPLVTQAVDLLRALRDSAPVMVADGQKTPKDPLVFRAIKWNTNRSFDRIRQRAGVPHVTMKALRSTAGTDAANGGFDVSQAGDFLGHASYEVTRKHYVVRDLENKRAVAESLAARLRIA